MDHAASVFAIRHINGAALSVNFHVINVLLGWINAMRLRQIDYHWTRSGRRL